MHELSIAMSMIEMATEESVKRGGAQILAVHLRLGPLSGVVSDALRFSWDVACADTSIAGATLHIDEVPVVVHCAACGKDRTLDGTLQLACPVCGMPTPNVVSGRELEVVALEIRE